MRATEGRGLKLRAAFAATSALGILGLTACASASDAIPRPSGTVGAEIQDLARRARGGDKQAQLELGIAFEEGRGVPIDLGRAAALYRLAARQTGGTKWTQAPDVNGVKGRPQQVYLGPVQPGLSEAKDRLERLRGARSPDGGANR